MEYYKTVIIGGGPAGIIAGITLLKKEEDCCIIDKEVFPKNKTCGGLLTQKTLDLISSMDLGIELNRFYLNSTNKIELLNKTKTIAKFSCNHKMYLTNRYFFDELFVNIFKKMNGIIYENEKVTDVNIQEKIITTTKQKIKYDYLIIADGCKGISRKLFKKKEQFCMAVEADIPIEKTNFKNDTIGLEFGLKINGYCWIFPKNNYVNIGFCCPYDKKLNYLSIFKKILSNYRIKNDFPIKYQGAIFPYGQHDGQITFPKGNILLTGDAAAFTDCISGEGIYFSIKSGYFAALAIAENKTNEDVLKCYTTNCQEIINITNKSYKANKFFYKYKWIILKLMKRNESKLVHFCDNDVAYYNYGYNYDLKKIMVNLSRKILLK